MTIQFGGGPHARGLVRHARCDRRGTPRPDAQRRRGHRARRGARRARPGPHGPMARRGSSCTRTASRRRDERPTDERDAAGHRRRARCATPPESTAGTGHSSAPRSPRTANSTTARSARWHGVDAITDFMETSHAMAGHTMHRLTNQVITVDGDRAEARTYVDGLIMFGDAGAGVNAVGFYDDDLVRTAAGWRIARRRFTPVRVGRGRGRIMTFAEKYGPWAVVAGRVRRCRRGLRRRPRRAWAERRAVGPAPSRARRGRGRHRIPHRRPNPHAGSRSRADGRQRR